MDNLSEIHSSSRQQTFEFGRSVAAKIIARRTTTVNQSSTVLCLQGELGSGKTTFTQGLAKGLGYNGRLLSPTFLILRRYDLENGLTFYHIDGYRIRAGQVTSELGLPEIFVDPKAIIVIEWPEKFVELLPDNRFEMTFNSKEYNKRIIQTNIPFL